ncbi:MAG: radical SAM protein [Candidatus Omnitrophica bacterium]|nr:radical SAM protein [Candidatus Omnitrophota bacterium]
MQKPQKIKVGLVQVGENFSGQYYLPYSVGLLQAYALKRLKKPRDYIFSLPLYKREPFEKIDLHFRDADIIFFSVYMWNYNFSLEIAKTIKINHPKCCIVFGGPQIPESSERLEIMLRRYPFVDIACYGEGENPFVEILESFRKKDWPGVPSIAYINTEKNFVKNKSGNRISDLDQIPSPYLSGVFGSLMESSAEGVWSVMWETNRGCPFSCSYCAWGKDSKRGIYKYDLGRLFEEIDWFSKNKIEFIFCCDANFGLFKERDMQIVQKVAENKKQYGYPKAFSVQSTKNATRTIFELQKELNIAGLQKGVNLALQSVNNQTLKSVNRSNISPGQFRDLQKMFTDAGIATFSDMILGLPDESYQTFTGGVSDVIEGGQYNRIQFINLAVLENTEMSSPEYIQRYGLILKECKMVSHHTSISSDNEIPETQILVVGTSTMPKEDWVKTRIFCWMISLLHFDKLLQIPLIILNKSYVLNYKEIMGWFLASGKEYPIISSIVSRFNEKASMIQFGDTEFIASPDWLNIYWPADEFIFIKLCSENNLSKFYEEARSVILSGLKKSKIPIDEDLLDDALAFNCNSIKQPFITENKRITLNYNLPEFYQSALVGRQISLSRGSFNYDIVRTQDKWSSWLDWCKEVVWFGTKKGNYLYPFIKTN